MFKRESYWRDMATTLQAQLDVTNAALETATEHLAGIELRFANRAALISLGRDGRKLNFTFVRNKELIRITAMGTWEDDLDQWKRELFE